MHTPHDTDSLHTIARSELPAVAGGIIYARPKPPAHPAPYGPPAHFAPYGPPVPPPAPCYPGYGFGGYGFGGYRFGDYGFRGYGFRGFGSFR